MFLLICLGVGLVVALASPALLIRKLNKDLNEKIGYVTRTRYEVCGHYFETYEEADAWFRKHKEQANEKT